MAPCVNCIVSFRKEGISFLSDHFKFTLRTKKKCFKRRLIKSWTEAFAQVIRELWRRRRQRGRQKCNRFRLAKQQLCTWIMLFCTFLYRPCTATTWKCLIASFMEEVNKRRRICFSLSKLECGPQEINSREIRHFQQIYWNNRHKGLKKREFILKLTLPSSMLRLPIILENVCNLGGFCPNANDPKSKFCIRSIRSSEAWGNIDGPV